MTREGFWAHIETCDSDAERVLEDLIATEVEAATTSLRAQIENERKATAGAWTAFLNLALDARLGDGTSVLALALNPALRRRRAEHAHRLGVSITELAITHESADRGTYARLGNRANGRYVVKTYLDGWVTVGTAQPVDPDEFRGGWEVVSEAEARDGAPLIGASTTRCANSACPNLPHEGRFVRVETPTPTPVGGGPATSQVREYVVGFLISERPSDHALIVVLVRKNRPDWQAGLLNGVGGKVEAGETALDAMRREFAEEAGLDLEGWQHFLTIEEPGKRETYGLGRIHFFRLFVDRETFGRVRTMTDERIETHHATRLAGDVLPNLSWILPLALYRHDTYLPILASETFTEGQADGGVGSHVESCFRAADLAPQRSDL